MQRAQRQQRPRRKLLVPGTEGSAVGSPRSGQIAQLEARIHNSPRLAAQREIQSSIQNSPAMLAQRRLSEQVSSGAPIQRYSVSRDSKYNVSENNQFAVSTEKYPSAIFTRGEAVPQPLPGGLKW